MYGTESKGQSAGKVVGSFLRTILTLLYFDLKIVCGFGEMVGRTRNLIKKGGTSAYTSTCE